MALDRTFTTKIYLKLVFDSALTLNCYNKVV